MLVYFTYLLKKIKSLSSNNLLEAYLNANISYLTAANTILLSSFNLSDAYSNAFTFYLTAAKTISLSFLNLS